MKINVQTKRRGIMDVQELNAYQVAYGRPLGYRDFLTYIGIPAIAMAGLAFALWYSIIASIICGVVGAFFGAKEIMPKSVKRGYRIKAMQERNRFINNITQIMTDESKTTTKALSIAKTRTKGELKEDIHVLEARIQGADRYQIADAFREITTKYEDDVVFSQFFEQLETAIYEGRNNIDTLKQIKSYHNDVLRKTKQYMKIKEGYAMDMKQMMFIICVFIGAITVSFGFDTFYQGFAKSFVGWICGGAYYILMMMFGKKFFLYYFDDEIMNMGVKN